MDGELSDSTKLTCKGWGLQYVDQSQLTVNVRKDQHFASIYHYYISLNHDHNDLYDIEISVSNFIKNLLRQKGTNYPQQTETEMVSIAENQSPTDAWHRILLLHSGV